MGDAAKHLAELLKAQGWPLSSRQVEQLVWLADELLRWNQRRNLTAITRPAEVLEKHLIDSLSLLPHLPEGGRLLDIGSGAGFPGLPLKIARPGLDVVSVDAVAKKIQFQKHVVRRLGLANFTAVHGRIEAGRQNAAIQGPFDLVTARAVAHLSELVALAAGLMHSEGALIAMKGPEGLPEWQACRETLTAAGWQVRSESLTLPLTGAGRCLLVVTRKAGE